MATQAPLNGGAPGVGAAGGTGGSDAAARSSGAPSGSGSGAPAPYILGLTGSIGMGEAGGARAERAAAGLGSRAAHARVCGRLDAACAPPAATTRQHMACHAAARMRHTPATITPTQASLLSHQCSRRAACQS